ncbi:hypothetical protein [Chromobacterium haemolyticum]|uniref:Peptidase P60 n=1 Tax=Chromobacterium haemolyticum TaxID=394935 RepID=A0A1W0CCZ7_9NEIS|nr:hypothetical protein [Chromobacterium haemolyticum]OQS32598.1 hypothetical protein B0T45_21590 [Chromobacterium haemolyticum]
MGHWSDEYVGRDYVPGVADCAALAGCVAAEVLGVAVPLPGREGVGVFGRNALICHHAPELAERVAEPLEAQPVLLESRGRLQHIGVMCWLSGEWWVLHADEGAGFVIRQRLRDLRVRGYQVEGFYKWR